MNKSECVCKVLLAEAIVPGLQRLTDYSGDLQAQRQRNQKQTEDWHPENTAGALQTVAFTLANCHRVFPS